MRFKLTSADNLQTYELKSGVTAVVGRAPTSDIPVFDPTISRRHAELRQEGASYWIIDLGSTNGTEVNGKRVKRAKLSEGDTIVLGSTRITFDRERK